MASNETTMTHETVPIVRMEGVSFLASNNGTTTLNTDPTTTQFITFPLLPDVSLSGSGIDQQNLVFARSVDGNTFLLDASQLALLTDQAIPLYDGTNLFQVASEVPLETSAAPTKITEIVPLEPAEVVHAENNSAIQTVPNEDEILPPDRGSQKCSICNQEFHNLKQLQRHWRSHAEDKPHRCNECDASFNKRNNLLLHQATHCTTDPMCPICKRKFTRMASLKAHLMLHEVEENLTCSECGDEFITQFRLDKHLQDHLNEAAMDKSFNCRTCLKSFKKLSQLREHSKIHYKIKASLHRRTYKKNIDRSAFSHKCYFCGKQFQKPSQLIRHNRIHTGEKPFKCEACGKAFNQKGALLIHSVKHTGERPHVCDFCHASFAQKGNLRNHIRRVHALLAVDGSESVHKCVLCSCVFRKLGSLNAHMSRAHASSTMAVSTPTSSVGQVNLSYVHSDVPEEVPTSNPLKVIDELIAMSKHMESSKGNQQNLKKIVSDNNVNSDILQQALENSGLAPSEQGNNKSKPYVMTYADSATGVLKTHIMRNVGGVRWYQCVYCSKEFKKPSDLVRHIRIHTHEKPYKCDQCFRAFAVKSTLNAHVRTHSGVKEYSCEHCKKLFSTSGSLKVHLLLHTGAKPFQCNICSKSFRTTGHRNSHMTTHLNEKVSKRARRNTKSNNMSDINVSNISLQEPILITDAGFMQQTPKSSSQQMLDTTYPSVRPYRCTICQKGFKKSSHLKQHLRSHTGEKPYECNECHRAFVSNGVLKSHLKTHTGVKAYNCEVCDASFTTNGSLKRHMCVHRDDRPYMCPYCQKTFKTSMNCKKHMKTHRYELALGLASGVAVTVVSEGASSVINTENQKEVQNTTQVPDQVSENVTAPPTENSDILTSFPAQSLSSDAGQALSGNETLTQAPQQHQEVFNTQTGMIEQAEIVAQAPAFDAQTSIFTLSGSDFVENHLTLQLENNEDNMLSTSTSINDPLVSNVTDIAANSEAPPNVAKTSQNESDNVEKKEMPKKRRFKKPYKCLQCSKVFKRSSYLKQHILQHTGERPFRCSTCGHFFPSKRILNEHMRTHEATQDFRCEKCSTMFSTKKSLARHMAIHDTDHPFHCSYCSARFPVKALYKQHLNLFHQDNIPGGQGTTNGECQVITYANQPESVPEQIITDNNPVIESTTDKQDRLDYLPKHPHACTHCPKSFKKPSDLVRHMRIHTGEKPYACQTCGKAFTVKSTLDSHIKTHTGERNFFCHVCNSPFATKGSLKVHMRLHTGSRPFKCPHCDMTFRTSGHRKSHLVSHFKDKSNRKRKTFKVGSDTVLIDNQTAELPPTSVPDEVISIQAETENPISVSQEDIQLHLPTLVGPNIHITTVDPSFISKPIQIDPSFLQQLQQNFNITVTLTPTLSDQISKLVDVNQSQSVLNLEANPTNIPVTSGTFNVSPVVHYTIPQQSETQVTDSIPLTITDINLAKNATSEVFQNNEILDSHILTLDNNIGTEVILESTDKSTTDILSENCINNYSSTEEKNSRSLSDSFTCAICLKSFKTIGQLNAHEALHKTGSKFIYHCEICNKNFKKNNHFIKHMLIHSS